MTRPLKVEIYSDVACPWCYVGERRFSRALSAFPGAAQVEVVFRPFQLDPAQPETPSPLRERLAHKFGDQLDALLQQSTAAATQEGLTFRYEDAQAVNTFAAHRLMRYAEQEAGTAVQQDVADRLFEAYFSRGENVADPALLARIGAEAGLDHDRVAAYLASGEGVDDVRADIARAAALGIRAVPTFVFNGQYAVQGAQPTSTFLQVLETVQQELDAENALNEAGAAEACADGACTV